MKFNKKTVTVLSFTLGATMFLSTAFADALIGSGYDQFKGSIKTTAAQMENGLSNYTMEGMYTMKDNGKTFMEVSEKQKFDNVAKATERINVTQYAGGEPSQNYSYSDPTRSVWKSSQDDTYYVTEYTQSLQGREKPVFEDPFKEQGAAELEKVFDAVVGNLKDYVQSEERTDGGKTYSASLSEAQVPAIVNAVASFGIKQILADEGRSNRELPVPQFESDVYVKKVTGLANQLKGGILENMTGEVILSGKDKSGNVHDLSVSVTVRLIDAGATKIVLPDLTNANVSKVEQGGYGFSSKYVGTYKNDIILEKNGQFVKAGERKLEITSVDQNNITGTYSVTVKPGFEAEVGEVVSSTFNKKTDQGQENAPSFTYTTPDGKQGTFHLFPNGSANLYMEVIQDGPARDRLFNDGGFIRIFE